MNKIIIFICFISAFSFCQENKKNEQNNQTHFRITTYVRSISNKNINRFDENLLTNYTLKNGVKIELGFRFGNTSKNSPNNNYYNYKFEVQTKEFFNKIKFIARISNNLNFYTYPSLKLTNYMFISEYKKIKNSFQYTIGLGYLISFEQSNTINFKPSVLGTINQYPIFKISTRYAPSVNDFFELAFGSYDIFNPYEINKPFLQTNYERKKNKYIHFFSYFRYQYVNVITRPNNYFVGLGVNFKF